MLLAFYSRNGRDFHASGHSEIQFLDFFCGGPDRRFRSTSGTSALFCVGDMVLDPQGCVQVFDLINHPVIVDSKVIRIPLDSLISVACNLAFVI